MTETDAVEKQAERALTSVARKLNNTLSVSHDVNELIAQATDVNNLGKIYHGMFLVLCLRSFLIDCTFRLASLAVKELGSKPSFARRWSSSLSAVSAIAQTFKSLHHRVLQTAGPAIKTAHIQILLGRLFPRLWMCSCRNIASRG